MTGKVDIIKNRLGYYEVREKPHPGELAEYYQDKYYQQQKGGYAADYSSAEIKYFNNKIRQKFHVLKTILREPKRPARLLEIGSGEGFTLKFFMDQGWEVRGVDYSDHGCRKHNPECLEQLTVGDINTVLDEYKRSGSDDWDVIWLDNVLEHVIQPDMLLKDIRNLLCDVGVLVVEVPNDFSRIQQYVLENDIVEKRYWVATPDHLSYFNTEGLKNLCEECGYQIQSMIGDHPIELNLLNPDTNYVNSPAVGKNCHLSRIATENLMSDISLDLAVEYFRILAEMGLGRTITAFATTSQAGN